MATRSLGSFSHAAELAENDTEYTFEFFGEVFSVGTRIGVIPLMRLSHSSDLEADSAEGMSALLDMLKDCLKDEDEFKRFLLCGTKHRASAEDLMQVCNAVYSNFADGTTSKPTGSSNGQPVTSTSSKPKSSRSRVSSPPTDLATKREANKPTG